MEEEYDAYRDKWDNAPYQRIFLEDYFDWHIKQLSIKKSPLPEND